MCIWYLRRACIQRCIHNNSPDKSCLWHSHSSPQSHLSPLMTSGSGPLAFVCVVSLTMQAPLRCGASAAHGPSTTSEASLASDAAARLSHASNGAGRLPIVPRPRPLGELSLPPHTPPTPHPHPGSPSSQPHTSLNPTQPHPTPLQGRYQEETMASDGQRPE